MILFKKVLVLLLHKVKYCSSPEPEISTIWSRPLLIRQKVNSSFTRTVMLAWGKCTESSARVLCHLIANIGVVDLLSPHHPDVVLGEDSHLDSL